MTLVNMCNTIFYPGLKQESVEEVFMGNVVSAGAGQAPARQAAIYAGRSLTPKTRDHFFFFCGGGGRDEGVVIVVGVGVCVGAAGVVGAAGADGAVVVVSWWK